MEKGGKKGGGKSAKLHPEHTFNRTRLAKAGAKPQVLHHIRRQHDQHPQRNQGTENRMVGREPFRLLNRSTRHVVRRPHGRGQRFSGLEDCLEHGEDLHGEVLGPAACLVDDGVDGGG